jgi:hypothetical protein
MPSGQPQIGETSIGNYIANSSLAPHERQSIVNSLSKYAPVGGRQRETLFPSQPQIEMWNQAEATGRFLPEFLV